MKKAIILSSLVSILLSGCLTTQAMTAEEEAELRSKPPLERLTTDFDDFKNITWYEQSYFTHYNNRDFLSLYIGQNDEEIWLRLKASYEGDEWIFFKKCYLSYAGNTYDVIFNQFSDKKTDHDTRVWEWIDISVDDNLLAYLAEYAYSETPKIRLSGKYNSDRDLSRHEIFGLQDILEAYYELLK